jgi:hypothetical protein
MSPAQARAFGIIVGLLAAILVVLINIQHFLKNKR